MPTFVVLLRAVNVGGRTYRMADLREHLGASGLEDVQTHIQTGNVWFRTRRRSASGVAAHVERVLGEHAGFAVPAVVLTPEELRTVARDAAAFRDVSGEGVGRRRYVSFFKPDEAPDGETAARMAAWDQPGEGAVVRGRAVHVWLDHPTHEARFFREFAKPLAPGTARDLKVVTVLVEKWAG